MTSSDIETVWSTFRAATAYKVLEIYPEQIVKQVVFTFTSMLQEVNHVDACQWDNQMVAEGLTVLNQQAQQDSDPLALTILKLNYSVLKPFLLFWAKAKESQLQVKPIRQFLKEFEVVTGMDGSPIDVDALSVQDPIPDQPWLAQWQERTANDIQRYTQDWLTAYLTSPAWAQDQATGVTEDQLDRLLTYVVTQGYDKYRKTPKSWSKKVLAGVLDEVVANLDLTAAELSLTIPAMGHLLEFAGEQGWLNAKKASTYQRYLTDLTPETIERAKDDSNFGPDKQIFNAMVAQGIDIEDEAAVRAFLEQIKAQGGLVDSKYEGGMRLPDGIDLTADEYNLLLDDDDLLYTFAERYEPDPGQDYLRKHHVMTYDGRKWQEDDADSAHVFGIVVGLQVWLRRQDYQLSQQWQVAENTLAMVAGVADMLYSQHLITLEQSTPAIWQEFGRWIQDATPDPDGMRELMRAIAHVLQDAGYMAPQAGDKLIAALTTGQPKQQKKTGNVLSFAEARKRRQHKKR